jgi:capsular exopolysaccharide synthesis family protein
MNAPIQVEALEARPGRQRESFHEYLRVIGRHRFSIIGITMLFALLGMFHAAIQTPIYSASAMLQIEREATRYIEAQELYGTSTQNFEYYQTQYAILRTRPLSARVVDMVGARTIVETINSVETFSLRRYLPFLPAPPPPAKLSEEQAREYAIGIVQGALEVEPIRNSQLVRIYMSVPSAELAAKLANALAQAYVDDTLEARLKMISDATTWLSGRLEGLRAKVEESERKLQSFKDQQNLVDVKGVDSLSAQQVSMLTNNVAETRAARIAKEALYRQVRDARIAKRLQEVPALLINPLVSDGRAKLNDALKDFEEVKAKYGPKMPAYVAAETQLRSAQRAFDLQLEQAAASVEREYESARSVETQTVAQLESAKGEARQVSAKTIELNALEREAEANRQVYERFQAQFKQTSESGDMRTSNARLVEQALVPGFRSSPNTRRTVFGATLIGLLFAVVLAFLLEHLDSTIKTAEDVERLLEVPVLGLTPNIKAAIKGDGQMLKYYQEHQQSQFAESVRTVRTNVLLSALDRPRKRLLVTSSVPGEGKTTLALNLTQSLGQMNKVLLIDADMRRPTVARVFGSNPPTIGLSQFISGESKMSECVHQLEHTNMFVMTAGVIPPNPLELLSSQKFAEALNQLNKVFEYIVIDCAPALAVSDALVLSRLVDGVIYVIKCDATPHQAAASGLKRLKRVEAPLLGVVLNRVGERSHGYGYGRYAYYADGYYSHYGHYQQLDKKSRKKS